MGALYWAHPNTDASNLSGFTALPGGHWDVKESFSRMGHYAYFWTCDSYDSLFAHECSLNFETSYFLQDWGSKQRGMSVRCIKDAE
ncbi:MAG: hypothetical protein IT235_00275 [Bacteroidia bacterium]|nr:hypothetical protein [Bacteroidia bacterium]